MGELPLDPETAERLLSGQIAPDDAPPGYAELAAAIRAAHYQPPEGEQPGEAEAVGLMLRAMSRAREAAPSAARVRRSARQVLRANVAALTTVTVLVSTTSLAAAGVLPRSAQVVMSRVLSTVGLDIPNPEQEEAVTLQAEDTPRPPRAAAESPVEDGATLAAPSSTSSSTPSSSTTSTTEAVPAAPAAEECVALDETADPDSSTTTTTTPSGDGSTTTTTPPESTTTTTQPSTTTTTAPPDDGSSTTTTQPDPIAEAQEAACGSTDESSTTTTTTTTPDDGSTSTNGSSSTASDGEGPPGHSNAVFRRNTTALVTEGEGAELPPP